MVRRQGRARRLVVGAETYLWSVRHIHRPERCAERLTLRRRGSHGHLRVTFEAGPGHYVPDGWLHSGAGGARGGRMGAVRRRARGALSRGRFVQARARGGALASGHEQRIA